MTERKSKGRLAAGDAGVRVNTDPGQRTVRQLAGAYVVRRNRPYAKNPALEAVHSAAKDLHEAGALDVLTMRHFDQMCLSEVMLSAEDVRAIRHQNRLSQTVFARYLGTSESTVKQWESGAKQPSGMARTLLNAVRKHGIDVLS
ncbi:helix-turn-helix domain-containing protein [Herbaspirillum chlorophenolicum]|uniref:Helix-turn-helix domain-containing protein n=1 Tax=Herbaspirillum chlorophenolicum TaxID=211589 RepID=A0ABW8F1R5_9BURK